MKWILAKDRLPEIDGSYFIKGTMGRGSMSFRSGSWDNSNPHLKYFEEVIEWLDETPEQSFSREEVVKLLAENRIETIKSTSPQYYEEVYKPLFEESDKEELKKWLDQKLNTH